VLGVEDVEVQDSRLQGRGLLNARWASERRIGYHLMTWCPCARCSIVALITMPDAWTTHLPTPVIFLIGNSTLEDRNPREG